MGKWRFSGRAVPVVEDHPLFQGWSDPRNLIGLAVTFDRSRSKGPFLVNDRDVHLECLRWVYRLDAVAEYCGYVFPRYFALVSGPDRGGKEYRAQTDEEEFLAGARGKLAEAHHPTGLEPFWRLRDRAPDDERVAAFFALAASNMERAVVYARQIGEAP